MVDIVIVNWNSRDFLDACMKSIFNSANSTIINKVIIIDNHSTDQSLQKIAENDKTVIVRNTENYGFAMAANQGFQLSTAPYLLLLNPDTQLFDTTLADCVSFMKKNKDVDVLGCQLLHDDGTIAVSCARFPTSIRMFYDASGLSKLAPSIFKPATLMTDWDHKTSRFVDQVMGAFMFMKRSTIDKTGFFDERFFVYFEELDFSKRLHALGGKSYYNAEIKAIHSENGTTRSIKGYRLFLILRSRLQYAKKHFSALGYSLVWISTYFLEPCTRILQLLLTARFSEIKDVFKGYRLLIAGRAVRETAENQSV